MLILKRKLNTDRVFELAIYLFTISFFFGMASTSIAYVLFLTSSIPIVYKNFEIRNFFSSLRFVSLILYFLCNFITLLFLSDSFEELLITKKLLSFFFLPIIFFSSKNFLTERKRIFKNIYNIFVFAALISFSLSLAYGLYRSFYASYSFNSIYLTYNKLSELFGVQPIYMAVYYLLAILFCAKLVKLNPRKKKLYISIGVLLCFAIIQISSRTSYLILLCIIIPQSIRFFSNFSLKIKLLFFISIILTSLILTISIPTLKNRVINFNSNVSSYSGLALRTKIWENTFDVFTLSPIYGHGLGKSQKELAKQYKKVNFRRAFINNFNAHNQYIQTSLDSGLIGLSILLLILIYPLIYSKLKFLHFSFGLIIIISLLTESFFLRQPGILFFTFFTSVFYILDIINTSSKNLKNTLGNKLQQP